MSETSEHVFARKTPVTIPVTVIGGFLGAGKTSLVNHLLRHADGLRIAVLVNDFGALPIDRDLIVGGDGDEGGDTLEISGGCVCCSYGSDLMDALLDLPRRRPGLDRVLIETSGVALPGMVASSVGLLEAYAPGGIVVLADAEAVRRQAADAYLGDTIARQLAAADLVILNRCDLIAAGARDETLRWLEEQAPHGRAVPAERSVVPVELVLGLRSGDRASNESSNELRTPGGIAASVLYESIALTLDRPVDVDRLAQALTTPDAGVLRAKGCLHDTNGRLVTLQIVGRRPEIADAPAGASPGTLVVIGLRGRLDRAAIDQAISGRGRAM
ncbi:MAG: GTP-binding protein [Reyranella sp.]|nr:GTP-binding protein [Reyranella sp.]